MIKNKLFSTLASSVLALSMGAPSILASVPMITNTIVNEQDVSIEEQGQLLLELLKETPEEFNTYLSDIYVSFSEDSEIILFGTLPDTYTYSLTLNEEETIVIEDPDDLYVTITPSDIKEEILTLEVLGNNEVIQEFEINLSSVIEQLKENMLEESDEPPKAEEENNPDESEDNSDTDIDQDTTDIEDESEKELNDSEKTDTSDEISSDESKESDGSNEIVQEDSAKTELNDQDSENEIQSFNLRIASSKAQKISNGIDVNYTTIVGAGGFSVDSLPWGYDGYQRVGSTTDIRNQKVQVIQETRDSKYVLIEKDGQTIGWVDRRALKMAQTGNTKHSRQVNYPVEVTSGGYSVDTLPWGTPGYQKMTRTSDYLGQEIYSIRETNNKEYILLASASGSLIGWVDHRSVSPVAQRIHNGLDVNQTAIVGAGGFTIDSLPWGVYGYKRISSTTQYLNEEVKIVQETSNGEYVLIEQNNRLIGWVDRRSLKIPQIGNPKDSHPVNFEVTIKEKNYSVDTLPWGTDGYQKIDRTANYVGKEVTAIRQTNNGNYLLLELDGKLFGWVDYRAIEFSYEVGIVSNSFAVDYPATIVNGGYSIDTLPWGASGYQRIYMSQKFIGTKVRVTQEYGAYALVELNGTPLGWVDRSALNQVPRPGNASLAKNVNYSAHLISGYSIDTLPWGQSGYRRISRTSYYDDQEVRVTKETGNYALIKINSREIGWVDRRALRLPIVYVDPGHGGSDPGAIYKGINEARLNLATSKILNDILTARHYDTVMSRTSNSTTKQLSERSNQANRLGADIFVSIHHNSMGGITNGRSRGIETFIHHRVASGFGQETDRNKFRTDNPRIADSLRLADRIHPLLISRTGMPNRGIKGNNFHVLRETRMPAILIELGFGDNSTDLAIMRSSSYQKKSAKAIADGIDRYFDR